MEPYQDIKYLDRVPFKIWYTKVLKATKMYVDTKIYPITNWSVVNKFYFDFIFIYLDLG
jgi:hypothetical protein